MFRILAIMAMLLAPAAAFAQSSVLNGGSTTAGHVPMYSVGGSPNSQTVVQDSGPASGGGPGVGIGELGLTARGSGTAPYAGQGSGPYGTNFCNYDAPITNGAGYHYFCMSPNAQGGGLLAYGSGGGASSLPLYFIVNGTTYSFPFATGGIVGPGTTVVNDVACWNNTTGTLLNDCGPAISTSTNNTWTGTNNFTGTFKIGGTTESFPASGNILGTSDIQPITNKHIVASQIDSGTLPGTVMPAYSGDVAASAGTTTTTIQPNVVSNAKLAQMSANTVKANGTGSPANATDFSMPSCSASGNALQWLSGTGFQCDTLTNQTAGWGLTGTSTFSVSTSAPPFSFDLPINMGLSASVGSSNLTINLTTANGSTPSSTNPVLIPFRSTTAGTGTVTWGAVTSALSIVVPSAATLGTQNNVPFRIWIFAEYNGGVPELGVAICSAATAIYSCTSWEATTVTSTTITGFATSAGTLYATTGVSNDAVRIIGYATYDSGLATAGSWVSTPSRIQVMSPNVKKPGDIVQSVTPAFGTLTVVTYTSSVTATNVTAAITPTSTANLIRYSAAVNSANSAGSGDGCALQMYRGSTAVGAVLTQTGSGGLGGATSFLGYDAPGSVSSQTYVLKGSNITAGTCSTPAVNSQSATEVLEEIMGLLEPANDNVGIYTLTG